MTTAHFGRRQHAVLGKVAAFLLVFSTSLAAADQAPLRSQSAESSETRTTADTRPGSLGAASPKPQPVAMPDSSVSDTTAEVEVLRRFNELRREILDHRAKTVDWWLAATAIFLTLLGVVAVIAGYLGFKRFREIEIEAREYMESSKRHAEDARNFVSEIKTQREQAVSLVEGLTAETVNDNPSEARRVVESIQEDPAASPISQAVAAAVLLQRQGDIEEAVEKWRAIASVVDGTQKEIGARAWFSVGYLLHGDEKNDLEKEIDAYNKSIQLMPSNSEPYNNRGVAKSKLGRHEEAITDYDKAIRLKPDDAGTYNNRGIAKSNLGRHEEALADYDETIRLKPDHANAYNNRGNAKISLGRYEEALADYDETIRLKPDGANAYNNRGRMNFLLNRMDEARRDFETAIKLARYAGDETLASDAERALKGLPGEQAP